MAKKKTKQSKKKVYTIVGIIVGIVAIVLVIAIVCGLSSDKKYKLDSSQSLYVKLMKTAVAMDKVNGSGEIDTKTCRVFKDLAKAYNENTDWFSTSYCRSIIYADYADTEKTSTVYLYDDSHAAIYTFDKDIDYLTDYKFIESTEKGRSIIIKD